LKLLEQNIGLTLQGRSTSKDILNGTPIAQEMKVRTDNGISSEFFSLAQQKKNQ
jgi:hypothetical protein